MSKQFSASDKPEIDRMIADARRRQGEAIKARDEAIERIEAIRRYIAELQAERAMLRRNK